MRNKVDFKLYLVTDRKQLVKTSHFSSPISHLLAAVRQALKGGVRAIQLREKDLDTRQLLKLAYKMRELTAKYKAKLFINDRLDVALAVRADGVHLTQNSMPADAVRRAVHSSHLKRRASRFLIGVSTHSLKEAKQAREAGADFITLGPVYRTRSKIKYGEPLGISVFQRITSRIGLPVFALGGVRRSRMNEVKEAGAYGVAMISEIFKADDIKKRAMETINILENKNDRA